MNKKGFSTIEVLIVAVIIVVICAVGWMVLKRQSDTKDTNNVSTSEASLPPVNSKSDLTSAENAVKSIDIDKAIDTSDIDASLE